MALLSGLSEKSVFFRVIGEQKKNAPIEGAHNIAAAIASQLGGGKKR